MKTKSRFSLSTALFLSSLVAIPRDIWAAPQAAGQRAGEVSRVIPAVSIGRGPKTITASAKTAVDWQDLVNTQVNARARIALDDGSVLNVGSESSMKVVKHDVGAQQTELELTYGKLRTQAQKIAKPDGKFEVRTPAGVAGVVGTDFFVEYSNNTMTVIAFEGIVKVCNLAGVCVLVKAGQMTSVRSGDNSTPLPPTQATLDLLVATSKDTDVTGQLGVQAGTGPHLGPWGTVGIFVGIPAVVIPIIATRKSSGTLVPPSKGCTNPNGC